VLRRRILEDDEIIRHIGTVTTFREAHAQPMLAVRQELVDLVDGAELDAAVSNRHKRVIRIVRKLARMSTNLANLDDIGGCRVVVEDLMDMDPMCDLIAEAWAAAMVKPMRDYVANPKDTGYRARHFVVLRGGRKIEIQVRTVGQQRWADAVEELDGRRTDVNLKDGEGPEVVLDYFRVAGEAIFAAEAGAFVSGDLRGRLEVARSAVVAAGFYET